MDVKTEAFTVYMIYLEFALCLGEKLCLLTACSSHAARILYLYEGGFEKSDQIFYL